VTAGNEDSLRADPVPGETPCYADASTTGYALVNARGAWAHRPSFRAARQCLERVRQELRDVWPPRAEHVPGRTLLQPAAGPGDAATARFVAPGAPRSYVIGLRYRY
jgi:hypothetical protein